MERAESENDTDARDGAIGKSMAVTALTSFLDPIHNALLMELVLPRESANPGVWRCGPWEGATHTHYVHSTCACHYAILARNS